MELTKIQQAKIAQIAEQNQVRLLTMFGSQVTGQTHADSDLDIGVLFNDNPTSYQPLLSLQADLKEILPNNNLDVRYLHDTSPYFFLNAVYKGQLLYGDNHDYAKLCGQAFKEYIDTKPLRQLQETLIEKKQIELLKFAKQV